MKMQNYSRGSCFHLPTPITMAFSKIAFAMLFPTAPAAIACKTSRASCNHDDHELDFPTEVNSATEAYRSKLSLCCSISRSNS
eukprot:4044927-Amphidinium_carterae.1